MIVLYCFFLCIENFRCEKSRFKIVKLIPFTAAIEICLSKYPFFLLTTGNKIIFIIALCNKKFRSD